MVLPSVVLVGIMVPATTFPGTHGKGAGAGGFFMFMV